MDQAEEMEVMMAINLKLVAAVAVVALGTAATAEATLAASTIVAQAAPQTSQATDSGVTRPFTTLAQAVRLAEQRTNGRARKVKLERDDGIYVYKVKTVSKDGTAKVYVDFRTGNVDRVDGRGILARVGDVFDREDRRKNEAQFNALEASPVTLSDAIAAAETNTGARAIKAKMKDRYGSVYFEVSVIVDGSKRRIEVDAATAKIVAVSAPKDRDDDDDDDD